MSENLEPIEKVEPPCKIYYLQSSSGKVYRCYRTSEADKVIAHNKYKRCLAMARWCEAKWDDTATKYYKSVWYRKWEVRWLELAEKFKEAK